VVVVVDILAGGCVADVLLLSADFFVLLSSLHSLSSNNPIDKNGGVLFCIVVCVYVCVCCCIITTGKTPTQCASITKRKDLFIIIR